jgi:hypothetical protein
MSAFKKLHCGAVTIRQGPEWAVSGPLDRIVERQLRPHIGLWGGFE